MKFVWASTTILIKTYMLTKVWWNKESWYDIYMIQNQDILSLPCQLKDQSFIKFNLLVDYFFKKMNFISFERMLIVIIKVSSFICFLVIAFWISYTFYVSTLSKNCFADTQLSSTQRNKYQPMREQNWNKMTNLKPENWTHYHLFFRHLTLSRNNQSTHF